MILLCVVMLADFEVHTIVGIYLISTRLKSFQYVTVGDTKVNSACYS